MSRLTRSMTCPGRSSRTSSTLGCEKLAPHARSSQNSQPRRRSRRTGMWRRRKVSDHPRRVVLWPVAEGLREVALVEPYEGTGGLLRVEVAGRAPRGLLRADVLSGGIYERLHQPAVGVLHPRVGGSRVRQRPQDAAVGRVHLANPLERRGEVALGIIALQPAVRHHEKLASDVPHDPQNEVVAITEMRIEGGPLQARAAASPARS